MYKIYVNGKDIGKLKSTFLTPFSKLYSTKMYNGMHAAIIDKDLI